MESSFYNFLFDLACPDAAPPSPVEGGKRTRIVPEVDFISHKKSLRVVSPDLRIRKEDFTINTGLRLAYMGTPFNEEGKSKTKAMQAELERMTKENLKLQQMLSKVTNKYNALQTHFVTLMQQQSQNNKNTALDQVGNDPSKKLKINGGPLIVPRHFLDLRVGLSADAGEQSTHSSSDDGSQDTIPSTRRTGKGAATARR